MIGWEIEVAPKARLIRNASTLVSIVLKPFFAVIPSSTAFEHDIQLTCGLQPRPAGAAFGLHSTIGEDGILKRAPAGYPASHSHASPTVLTSGERA